MMNVTPVEIFAAWALVVLCFGLAVAESVWAERRYEKKYAARKAPKVEEVHEQEKAT